MNTSDTSTSHATGADDPRVAGEGRSTPGPRQAAGADVIGQFSSSLPEHQVELAALREGLVLAEPPAGLAELEAALCRAVRRQRHAWKQWVDRRGWSRRH